MGSSSGKLCVDIHEDLLGAAWGGGAVARNTDRAREAIGGRGADARPLPHGPFDALDSVEVLVKGVGPLALRRKGPHEGGPAPYG